MKAAILSPCGTYHYTLSRTWDDDLPKVMFLMLNPSTADGYQDDATINRCVGFARAWGYGGLHVGNLFAYRSTNPNKLHEACNPIGPDNELFLKSMIEVCEKVILAWGNDDIVKRLMKLYPNYKPLSGIGDKAHHLKLMKSGHPRHPLYLRSELKPVRSEFYYLSL